MRPLETGLRRLQWVFLATVLIFSHAGRAQNPDTTCTWLNQATASGVLGGVVTMDVKNTPDGGGTCIFRSLNGKTVRTLQIDVRISKDARQEMVASESKCTSPPVPIRGVGNEAVSCSADAHSLMGEQIISYVRDQPFVLRIGTTDVHDLALTRDYLQLNSRNIAEQVAGSLF